MTTLPTESKRSLHWKVHGPDNMSNKKVLMHECKKRTTCHIASACSADLSPDWGVPLSSPNWGGYPHPVPMGGTPSSSNRGYPHPVLTGRYPLLARWGYLPNFQPDGGTPIGQMWILPHQEGWGTPQSGRMGTPASERMGYPCWPDGVPLNKCG